MQRPPEGAQVRLLAHGFGVLVHEPDGRGEGGADLYQGLTRFDSSARPTGSGASEAISAAVAAWIGGADGKRGGDRSGRRPHKAGARAARDSGPP
ncbi:hypothetical protein ACMZ5E_19480 [Streptomyces rhizosphaericola]|uniref:hypothetical protein n=1 Tax=Streptomyces rhizosphaericola TaxID=2564098 RepID=UPI0039EE834A